MLKNVILGVIGVCAGVTAVYGVHTIINSKKEEKKEEPGIDEIDGEDEELSSDEVDDNEAESTDEEIENSSKFDKVIRTLLQERMIGANNIDKIVNDCNLGTLLAVVILANKYNPMFYNTIAWTLARGLGVGLILDAVYNFILAVIANMNNGYVEVEEDW